MLAVIVPRPIVFPPIERALRPTVASRGVTRIDTDWLFGKSNAVAPKAAIRALISHVTLPHTWNARDMMEGNNYYVGGAWYLKTIAVPPYGLKARRLFVRFQGVGSVADVYLNDEFVGEHKGSFSAFCFDLTPFARVGTNTLMVRADNTPRPDVIPINMALFPIYGGIYRHVDLISTPNTFISPTVSGSPGVFLHQTKVTADVATVDAECDLQTVDPNGEGGTLRVEVDDAVGKRITVASTSVRLAKQDVTPVHVPLTIRRPHLWAGRADPYEYMVKVTLRTSDGIDEVEQKLGLRWFGLDSQYGFLLNGKPYRLYGVCRHQDREGFGNALSDEQQREDFALIHDMGATAVRLAHYQQADVAYRSCDKNGLVVWAEVPFVNAVSGKEAANVSQQLRELILQNYNHPSIAFWGVCNEIYGKDAHSYVPVEITKLIGEAKSLDSTRFAVETSGAGNPFGVEVGHGDVQGFNRYYGWYYGKFSDLDPWINSTEKARPGMPFAITEYGAEGNVHQQSETLIKQFNATNGAFFPENYETYYHERTWPILAKHPELVATFVWNMFDFTVPGWNRGGVVNRNMKGLVTFDHKTKKDAFYFYQANWTENTVIHLVGSRVVDRTLPHEDVEVYCNYGTPKLTLNGVDCGAPSAGATDRVFVFHVTWQPGQDVLTATCAGHSDSCRFTYT